MAELDRLPRARRLIQRTHRRLRDLALWRAWWPVIVLVSIFLLFALLGVFEQVSKTSGAMAVLILLVGLIIGGLRGWRRFAYPTVLAARQAADAQSELRPLATLQDRPTSSDPAAMALWRAHEARLKAALRRLSTPRFSEQWRQIDPLYLRAVMPLALLAAIALNWGHVHSRLSTAFNPDFGSLLGAESVRVQAWITPPEYTLRAPLFVQAGQPLPNVPEGSEIVIRATAPTAPKLVHRTPSGQTSQRFKRTPDGAYETTAILTETSALAVHWWGPRYRLDVMTGPDLPPQVQFVSDPLHTPTDRLEISWSAQDDYGVSKLELAIQPLNKGGPPDYVPIEFTGVGRTEIETETTLDLSRNRWAGAKVDVSLRVTDGAGQTARSAPFRMTLPNRLMIIPLAKAIQDARLTLMRDEAGYDDPARAGRDSLRADALYVSASQRLNSASPGVQRAAMMLEAITYDAPRYIPDILLFSGLESARFMLASATDLDATREAEPLLWALALRAEYGSAADAYAALMAAKAALENALRDGASEAEIKRLMEAFKDAAQRYVAAKMAEALGNINQDPANDQDNAGGDGGPSLGGDTFSDMLDALEDLTETGASDQARQLLADITNMLENLEFQQGSGSGEGFPGMPGEQNAESDEDISEEEREISETMQELLDLLREQRQLNDETLAQQRGETGQTTREGQEGQQNDGQRAGQGDRPSASPEDGEGSGSSLAERQRDLAEGMGEFRENSEDGLGAGEGLDEDILEAIERAQRRAGSALEDFNEGRAIRNQEQATRQLHSLADELAQTLDAMEEARRGENASGDAQSAADPFGNPASSGIDDGNTVEIPDQLERDRARDILEELRRRYGDAEEEDERDYLDRLLDRF